jgi:hypothetical protein
MALKESGPRTRNRAWHVPLNTHMLTLQAILLTSSLLMVMAMVGSLLFLATLRERVAAEPVPVEPLDHPL